MLFSSYLTFVTVSSIYIAQITYETPCIICTNLASFVRFSATNSQLLNGINNNGSNDYFSINRILITKHRLQICLRH
jgi:hypothetical protein